MKSVFLVMVNFNSAEETHDCLHSLQKLKTPDISLHIIVVDNGSKEKFVLTEQEKKKTIHLIQTGANLGFTGGNNVGIRYGLEHGADYIMLLNNDTIVDENLLTGLLSGFEKNEKVGMVVPKIYFAKGHEYHGDRYTEKEKGKVLWYAGGYIDWNNVFNIHRGVDEVDHGQYDKEEFVNFATGCCVLIKSDVLKSVGYFDDTYFLYFEDGDLSQRILRAGYKIVYQPKAFLWHITAASGGGSGSILHDYYLTRNRMIFGMRYAPIKTKFALIRESIRLFTTGRKWQRIGIKDYYLHNLGKGSFGI